MLWDVPIKHKKRAKSCMNDDCEVKQLQATIEELRHQVEYDAVTGLLNTKGFVKHAEPILQQGTPGEYALLYFDVLHFKAINDMFGMGEGDKLLQHIASVLQRLQKANELSCRFGADRFMMLAHRQGEALQHLVDTILDNLNGYGLSLEIVCNMGIYVTTAEQLSVVAMADRAILAQSVIKGSYTEKYNYYTEELRKNLLDEQEIVGNMATELDKGNFVVYYQPQYDHSNGLLVGAEALVRWQHPEKGLISPGVFIPIFEKNGFITKLDYYVFEQTCRFIRQCLDAGLRVVPISINFSRYDIYQPDFVERLEKLRQKYAVPVQYLRVEITETAVVGTGEKINEIIGRLHQCGYIMEMDDFGSGYSSLNVLHNVDMDIIKLDMLFFSKNERNHKSGTIISSVVRMAKWLKLPVIAEGVETVEQADFLRSIGCNYIQGFLYSKPVPAESFKELLRQVSVAVIKPTTKLEADFAVASFWEPGSELTTIFNRYMGPAVVFEYCDGQVEFLRVNQKYLQEIGMNMSEVDLIRANPLSFFDEVSHQIMLDTLHKVIATGQEQECETWRELHSDCCGSEKLCLRSSIQLIGKSANIYLFFAQVRNVTHDKQLQQLETVEKRFMSAAEQANIYFWEYNILNHEMRPCFRCMRDLGLPPLLTNYPESAIEAGIFPPDYADMYRDWHKQLAAGVPSLEAVIPLTANRIPFHVRYTTEFDATGHPVKAYGSATLVVDEKN